MEKLFKCTMCGRIFEGENAEAECNKHEETCQKTYYFYCDNCGKIISYVNTNKLLDAENLLKKHQCHTLRRDDRPEWGSELSGKLLEINLCDECMVRLIECLEDTAYERIMGYPRVIEVEESEEE